MMVHVDCLPELAIDFLWFSIDSLFTHIQAFDAKIVMLSSCILLLRHIQNGLEQQPEVCLYK